MQKKASLKLGLPRAYFRNDKNKIHL